MEPKAWLDPMLRNWAAQKKRILNGGRRLSPTHANPVAAFHEDGWPPTSVAAMAREGGITGGAPAKQHFAEVYFGDGLAIWRAMHGCPIEVRESVYMHYLALGNAAVKAEIMGISKSEYWQRINVMYYYLAGRIEESNRAATA